jgi:hypothetical protein
MNAVRALIAVLLIAVIGLTAALIIASSDASSTNARQAVAIRELRARMAKAESSADAAREVTAVKGDVSTVKDDLATLKATARSLSRKIAEVTDCLPEIQTEINSIDVDRYGYISTNTQVSRPCQKIVYPGANGD